MVEIGVLYAIVVAGLAIEEVDANLRTVEREVELLLVVAVAEVLDVECVTEEQPSPADVGTNLDGRPRGEHKVVAASGADGVRLIRVGVLHHEREIVFLRLDVVGVHPAEVLYHLVCRLHQSLEKRLTLSALRYFRAYYSVAVSRHGQRVRVCLLCRHLDVRKR